MIYIQNLIKTLPDRKLFEIDSLSINENDKIALIGENATGKTTLIRIILGLDKDYTGQVRVDRDLGYLLNYDIQAKNFSDEIYSKSQLKIDDDYSPGEEQRLKLTDILSDSFKFLLIDEPTSHLDLEQKEELIEKLNTRETGYLIISHDRDFINRTCKKILELKDEKIEEYNGDYNFYLEEREKRQKFQDKEYSNFIKEKRRLENLAINIKEQSSKVRTTPKRMGNSEARLHKMGGQKNKKKLDKQVKAVESRINQLDTKEKPKEEKEIQLSIPDNKRIHSKILIRAENLNKKFENKTLFEKSNFQINSNSKIALIGENGSGKTTLLKMILNKENIWVHPNLKIGYFSQMSDILEDNSSILKNVSNTSIYDETMTRFVLARLGFKTDDVYKIIRVLSDGEKAKVKLAKILTSDFNYLIFDEPTNFLDIRAIESLENLLKTYDRPFIFVSHDEEFINKIADTLLIIENKRIKNFKGNLAQYKSRDKKTKISKDRDSLLLDFRISSISSRLAMEISKEEREKLEEEYNNLIEEKNNRF
ncbi:MAG: ribosomal protection-like ABC-F family protein [Finegoldia magna]|uniref:ribosomal protection-like ABC-F family protein n=1 Tax=Finegoldia magna TaxID=1260 RepID=UPI000B916E58|nr:ABC-F family ATP-binding cassette domain-containing protein [Finegoldia magna]MDU7890116.1 ABC-F family ATP-binding cassette domain-containing protein [Finegoldia magna]OXZ37451.1 macrolide ABC transporter ATP-binding protein [Finegoldia magna]